MLHPNTETIDALFLELSQFTTAQTRKELEYRAEIRKLKTDNARLAGVLEAGKAGWNKHLQENKQLRDLLGRAGHALEHGSYKEQTELEQSMVADEIRRLLIPVTDYTQEKQ